MTSAAEFQSINDDVFHWSVFEPACKCEVATTALRTQGGGLVLIDPVPLAKAAWAELLALAPLRAILLTNANHVRDAERLRDEYQVPLVTAPLTRHDITEFRPEIALLPNELLYGLTAISIPGATAGETAFFHQELGVLALGDAVINLDSEKGLDLLPDKYCIDSKQNRASLRQLLNLDFRILTFAHGQPVVAGAKEKLRALLS